MITQSDWIKHFPYAEPRPEQIELINFALNAFINENKEYVILEAGVGLGKSVIAVTIAKYLNANLQLEEDEEYQVGSYFLTSQKILQDQYAKDFAEEPNNLKNLISSTNYDCVGLPGNKCSESSRLYSLLKGRFPKQPQEVCRNECPYKKAKNEFIHGHLGVTNYSYFLAETVYAGKLEPRELIVIDECHNLPATLSKFIEIRITEKFCDSIGVKFLVDSNIENVYKWVCKKYEPALKKMIKRITKEIEDAGSGQKLLKLSERLELLDKHICKIHRFQEKWNSKNWVMNIENGEKKYYEFKPVDVSPWSDELIFSKGRKKLLMSATLLDAEYYMNSLAIPNDKCAYLFKDTPFKLENRPIIYIPAGKMSYKYMDTSLPVLCTFISEILKMHPDEKGIIHATNFKIAEYIRQNIKSDRLIVQDRGADRNILLQQHIESIKPTVIVSPSMTEGVDLKDDLSRFQIFCKLPFPPLTDEMVKRKLEIEPKFYPYTTSQVIMQAVGRSIRNEKDYAVTYILDSCADDFFDKNSSYFPASFKEVFVDVNGKKIMKV
jgi:Rad3-related DNA helicase